MRSIVKSNFNFLKLSLAGLALALTVTCANANTLSEVQINAENNGYGIVLKTDENAQMKKVIATNDKMSIELKDVNVSEDLNTVYNNVANIDNVTIQQTSKNDIKIIFKGKDIAESKVYFETIKTTTAPLVAPEQAIQLSGPVSSYTPVFHPEELTAEEESQTSNPQLNETLTKMHITRNMLVSVKRYAKKAINKTKSGDINTLTILGVVVVFAAFALRPRRRKENAAISRESRGVGLSAAKAPMTNLDREVGMGLNMNNSLNDRYGMRAYQQSQKNPYMSPNTASTGVSGIARRKPAPTPVKRPVAQAPLRKAPSVAGNPIKPQMPNSQTFKAQTPSKPMEPSDLDSMKFLESITKIYEKNGRTDLAKGLKDNLRKAQLAR